MVSGQDNKHKKPNFLIVGAAKAGTTSAAKYLNEHPDIYIPELKELRFFVKDTLKKVNSEDPLKKGIFNSSILNEEDYFASFNTEKRLAGEASVQYLYHYEEAIPKIQNYLGDIPIIIFLRDPVKRAISNIQYLYNSHHSTIEKELEQEEKRIRLGYNSFWYYLSLGLYSHQVYSYLNKFSKVKIILFENFVKDPQQALNEIYIFLKVKPIVHKVFQKHNKSFEKKPYLKVLNKLGVSTAFKKIAGKKGAIHIQEKMRSVLYNETKLVPERETSIMMKEFYKKDILRLEKMIDIDLDKWKL